MNKQNILDRVRETALEVLSSGDSFGSRLCRNENGVPFVAVCLGSMGWAEDVPADTLYPDRFTEEQVEELDACAREHGHFVVEHEGDVYFHYFPTLADRILAQLERLQVTDRYGECGGLFAWEEEEDGKT
ncbi:hypothetical protein ACVWO2_29915, partial [Klebsiella pneumoniae]